MKIGILYICTGKYNIFWKDFYLSCEKNFITEAEKNYFVFTDSPEIDFELDNKNIHRVYQDNLGWPNNTLKRYEMFLTKELEIEKTDFLFFFNANLLFSEKITVEEFLPTNKEKLVGCLHSGYYNKPIKKYTYENNPKSLAFVNTSNKKYYYQGAINGGVTKDFIETIKILDANIREDEKNKIVAVWHDESHWNAYLNTHLDTVKTLSPAYLYYNKVKLPFKPKIIFRDKKELGGHSKFRNKFELRLAINSFKESIKKIINK